MPLLISLAGVLAILVPTGGTAIAAGDPSVFGVFVGSSPASEPIRRVLGIPSESKAELIVWTLTLHQDATTRVPSRFDLRCEYGTTRAGRPGLARIEKTLERQGSWTAGKGIPSNPDAIVYELGGALSLVQVDANLLHVLNPDRSLMLGNGGWSFTLNRSEHAEALANPKRAQSQPEMSYRISAVSTAPTVLGVFEGRTPCQGIARELKLSVDAACTKAKWRVTFHQDPTTRTPTTYKVEGSLYRYGPRVGALSIVRGTVEPNATVYRLAPMTTEPALLFMKGDDNVLFFLRQDGRPLVGHREFSYTLDRRSAP